METIEIEIQGIKNIKQATISMPFEKGLYAFVGENGCGKSTIMLAASLVMKKSSAKMLKKYDYAPSSFIKIEVDNKLDIWSFHEGSGFDTGDYALKIHPDGTEQKIFNANVNIIGFYEGSIFYGSRFDDYALIDKYMSRKSFKNELIDADNFVSESLGYILHNNPNYYHGLKKIKSKLIASRKGFKGMPYFFQIDDSTIVSQYRMSSGESMLISLFDFLNNLVIRTTKKDKLLFLIDEVELALHPSAIDRLVEVLTELTKTSRQELVIYFSTHSAELVQRISPKNLFLIENNDGQITMTTPCYPNYAIRNLYVPNGFDFLVLVEDELAKAVVDKAIRDNQLNSSKLCCVLPAGGYSQMIKLHKDLVTYNTLGVGKKIISIFDGDVQVNSQQLSFINRDEFRYLPKCFLPILSIEKYLLTKLVIQKNQAFIKYLGDKYFNQRSLKSIIQDYSNDERTKKKPDNSGKVFYSILLSNLEKSGIPEERFIQYLCDDIFRLENMTTFISELTSLLQ